jgi:hypothetical protein
VGRHGAVLGGGNGSKFFKLIQLILNDFKPFKLQLTQKGLYQT